MTELKSSENRPFTVSLEKDQKYFWCSCGLTTDQPFCDGSHKGSGMKSVMFDVDKDMDVQLCGCKQTKNPPYCDGSHLKI